MRRRFVMRDGALTEIDPQPGVPPFANVQSDLADYRSMRTGETIRGRAEHREHLKRYDLVEVGNERQPFEPKRMEGPVPGEIAAAVKRELARAPAERRALAIEALREAGYSGPAIDRIIGRG